jgi:hypothetical protein
MNSSETDTHTLKAPMRTRWRYWQPVLLAHGHQGRGVTVPTEVCSSVINKEFLMHLPAPALLLTALLATALTQANAVAAPGLDAYVLTVGGNSQFGANGNPFGCATFAPDAGARLFSRTFEVSLPTDGAICGVASDGRAVSATAGPAQTAATLAVSFGAPTDPRTFTGSAKARAGYGDLGVRAVSSITGTTDNSLVAGAQAGARQVEALTIGGASGSGTYRPTFTIDGSLFNTGRSESEIEFGYSIGSGPTIMAWRIVNSHYSGISLYANGAFQPGLPGLTLTGTAAAGYTVAGTTTFSLDIPILFGSSQEMSFSLWASTIPRADVNLMIPGGGDASFYTSAKLTGIEVLDSGGNALPAFTIASGSGTLYGPEGVIAVPEPSTTAMLCAGLLCMLRLRRRPARSA